MKAPRVFLLAVGFTAVLCAAAPPHAHEQLGQYTAQLTCGRSVLTAETRWLVSPDTPLIWLDQKIRLKSVGARSAMTLPLEGRQRKRVAAGRSGLDAVAQSWACVRSSSGASYILLLYGCGSDDAEKFCGGEREWMRILDEKGTRLDPGFARQDRRYDQLYEKLGLAKLISDGVSMSSVVSSD
ncbi:MAG: hypothetical protein ACXU86_11320 [Archangium sp.]